MRVGRRRGCARTLPLLQRYVDGELDDRAARSVAEHLRGCRGCGMEAWVYRELGESLRRGAPPSDAARDRLAALVRRLDSGH